MIANPIQFAVVREDPEIETQLMRGLAADAHAMLIGSGGCTAFTLLARFPSAELTLVDPNTSQIELIQKKAMALQKFKGIQRSTAFGIGIDQPEALTGCGNFESLFRSLRKFLDEFVLDHEDWLRIFTEEHTGQLLDKALRSKYWPVAFQLFFSDPILVAMFGPQVGCSNSRGVHKSMRGMYVKEETLWSEMEKPVRDISIEKSFADSIYHELETLHDKHRIAKKAEIAEFKFALKELEGSEDKIYDNFIQGVLDEHGYRRQIQRVREQRGHYTDLLEAANDEIDGAYLKSAKILLELATTAKFQWNSSSPTERILLLKKIYSDPQLDGVLHAW